MSEGHNVKNEPKSRLNGFVTAIGVIGGILGIITSIIVIYQFVSGKTDLPALPAFRIPSLISSTSISYNSFWTWFWWAIGGYISCGLVTMALTVGDGGKPSGGDFFGIGFYGIFLGILFGFLQSLLINFLHVPYGLLISIGVNSFVILIIGGVIYRIVSD